MSSPSRKNAGHADPEKFAKLTVIVNCYADSVNAHLKATGSRGRLMASLLEIITGSYDNERLSCYTTLLSSFIALECESVTKALRCDDETPFCKLAEGLLIGEAYILGELVEKESIPLILRPQGNKGYKFKKYDGWLVEAFDMANDRDCLEFCGIPDAPHQPELGTATDWKTRIKGYREAGLKAEAAQLEFSRECPVCEKLSLLKRNGR